jgi:hypothetical protein
MLQRLASVIVHTLIVNQDRRRLGAEENPEHRSLPAGQSELCSG